MTAEEYYRLNPVAATAAGIHLDEHGKVITSQDETPRAAKLQADARLKLRAQNRRSKFYRFILKSLTFFVVVSSAGLYIITEQIQPSHPWHKHVYDVKTFAAALIRLWRDIICVCKMLADYWW